VEQGRPRRLALRRHLLQRGRGLGVLDGRRRRRRRRGNANSGSGPGGGGGGGGGAILFKGNASASIRLDGLTNIIDTK